MNKFDMLKNFGSPLYIYNNDVLVNRCTQMANFMKELQNNLINNVLVSMHYSTKANNNPAILLAVKNAGLNVDCMSELELVVNEKCGFSHEKMLYVCNNISAEEMKAVHDKGVLICLDSISQVETWGKLFPGTEIMIRINPGTFDIGHSEKVITSGKHTKFGISESHINSLIEKVKKYHLNIIGIHQHLGSLFLNDKIDDYIAGVQAGLNIIKKYFENIKIIDLGGGFGIPYNPGESPLDLSILCSKLIPIINNFIAEYPTVKEFKFEPGRYIPCESGELIGTITSIKCENGIWWVGTDIGMNELIRPAMYNAYHKVTVITKSGTESSKIISANFCGNVCESADVLAKDREIHLPSVGDIVVVHNAGAYGFSMSSTYTGRARPAEVMIYNDNTVKLIRKRETIDDMLDKIVW